MNGKGFGKNHVTDDKDRVGAAPRQVIGVDELPRIREELMAAKGTPSFDALKAKYDGPDAGIDYNEDTDEIRVASTHYVDTNGNIAKKEVN